MNPFIWDEDGIYSPFEGDHADCIRDIRRALERKDYEEVCLLIDRFFDENGMPK